jgi:hypothetical protein
MLTDKCGEMFPLRHVSNVGYGFKCRLRASQLTLESVLSAPPRGGDTASVIKSFSDINECSLN